MSTLHAFAERLRVAVHEGRTTTKRDAAKPAGVDTWFRYYAGFSPTFARSVLAEAELNPTSVVLDPWNGSGTTTYSAAAMGAASVGIDISPVANLVASAKVAHVSDLAHSEGLTVQVIANARRRGVPPAPSHPLARWLHRVDLGDFLRLQRAILHLLARAGESPIDPLITTPPPLAAFFLLCLLRAARLHSGLRLSTNPTWVRPPARRRRLKDSTPGRHRSLAATFKATVKALTTPFSTMPPLSGDPGHARILQGDARSLPIESGTIDFVLTSPPYCTRLDYPISTSFELAALGMESNVSLRRLRYASMGTPLVRPAKDDACAASLPSSVRRLLRNIESHPSKNSDTYYAQTYRQYFEDAMQGMGELRRVLRPNGKAVLVLQTSFYKEIAIPLPDLYVDMAERLGFRATTVVRIPVQKVLTDINPSAQRHLTERRYVEAVIAIEAA
jgi:DNA modification methylase